MSRWSNWRDNLPLPAFFGLVFVLWTGVRLILAAVDGTRLTASVVVIEVIGGLVFAGILTGLLAWRRHRVGGIRTFGEMNAALRSGRLPENAEPSIWGPELERRRRALLRSRIWGPIFLAVLVAVCVWLLFLGGESPALPIIALVIFVVAGVASVFSSRRGLARLDSLLAQLDPRANPTTHDVDSSVPRR